MDNTASTESDIRIDGRKNSEIRKINCKLGIFEQADGSAYLEIGHTSVLAAVFGPHEVSHQKRGSSFHDRAFINCQYSQANFSTIERKSKPRADLRSLEFTNNMREIFNNVILTNLFPNSQIDIFLEVLQSDGSNVSACINAATLALIHAGVPIKDFVTSCSAALVDGKILIDVCHEESVSNLPIMTLAMLPQSKQIVFMESTGGIPLDNVEKIIDSAAGGCEEIYKICKTIVLNHVMEDPNKDSRV